MNFLVSTLLVSMPLMGCQIGYLIKSAGSQAELLSSRVPIQKVLQSPETKPEVRRKLALVQDVIQFAQNDLQLYTHGNYETYVELDRPYVSYTVTAATKNSVKPHEWWFPIVGHVPYKGYFSESDANNEALAMDGEGYDTDVRGVTAYSTLGWFKDPLLSSMFRLQDHDLVNLLIHESVHATLFLPGQAEVNEQFATFVGNKGTELYYQKREPQNLQVLTQIRSEIEDDLLFANFIQSVLKEMEDFYQKNPNVIEDDRRARFQKIKDDFGLSVLPKMKSDSYRHWPRRGKLNNAVLASYRTYFKNLGNFDRLYARQGQSIPKLLDFLKTIYKQENFLSRMEACALQGSC